MIGLVVVSHSVALAQAALELGEQMVPPEHRPLIAVAAGAADGGLGTDARAIAAAVESVSGPDGVLVLVDLGSAVLSSELALELVDPTIAATVRVCPGPLVEGLVSAMVAAGGATIDELYAVAVNSLDAKRLHLGAAGASGDSDSLGGSGPRRSSGAPATEVSHSRRLHAVDSVAALPQSLRGARTASVMDDVHLVLVVPNEHGLHARPAATLARLVADHRASLEVINLSRNETPVNGASLAGLTRLDARQGDQLALTASGPEAGNLITAILALAADNFGDPPAPGVDLEPELAIRRLGSRQDGANRRVSAATPVVAAMAPVRLTDDGASAAEVPDEMAFAGPLQRLVLDPDPAGSGLEAEVRADTTLDRSVPIELSRFETALHLANRQLESIAAMAADRIGSSAAAMVSVQTQLLTDVAVVSPVRASIEAGQVALEAWSDHLAMVRNSLEELDNPYLRARGQDVGSLERRVRACLLGRGVPDPAAARGVVLVDELDAPTAAGLRPDQVLAVLTRRGGDQGHGVMVARQRGIRVVVDVGDAFDDVSDGAQVSWPLTAGD